MRYKFLTTQRQEERQETMEAAIQLLKFGKAKLKEIPTETIVTVVTASVITIGLGILFVKAVKNYSTPKPKKEIILVDVNDPNNAWMFDMYD